MKTVTAGRGNFGRILFVLAALGAAYFYRRQGGSVRGLVERGRGLVGPVRDFIATRAPSVTGSSATQSTAPSATI